MRSSVSARLDVTLVQSATLIALLAAAGCSKPPAPPAEENRAAPVKVVPAKVAKYGEWTELLGTTQPLPNKSARISAAVEGRVVTMLGDGKTKPLAEGDKVKENQLIVQLDDSVPRAYRDKLEAMVKDLELQKKTDAQTKQGATESWLAVVQAELKATEALIAHFSIRSPLAGELGLIQVTPGQAIAAGTTVADVVNLEEVDVLCYVPPHAVGRLALGQSARLDPRQHAAGKVVFIAAQAEPETGNFPVKVRFPNKDGKLRANSVQRIQVLTQPEKERLTVPDDALVEDQVPPIIIVAQNIKIKRAERGKGHDLRLGTALRLRPVLGVRDRDLHLVEILQLRSLDDGDPISIRDVGFIVEGGNGLHDKDALVLDGDPKPRDDAVKLEDAMLNIIKERSTLGDGTQTTWSLTFSPNDKILAAGGKDGTVKLWDVAAGTVTSTLSKHSSGILCLAFSPDGTKLVSGGADGTVKLWDVANAKVIFNLTEHNKGIQGLAFSPDGKTFASGGYDRIIKLWDVASGKCTATMTEHDSRVGIVVFSPDGKLLASSGNDLTIRIWDLATGKNTLIMEGYSSPLAALAFTPDGKTLISWSKVLGKEEHFFGKSEIKFWDLASGANSDTVEGETGSKIPYVGVFSPNAKTLAWGAGEKVITLWDTASARLIGTLQGHTKNVAVLAFSSDGKTLASAGADNTIKLWNPAAAK